MDSFGKTVQRRRKATGRTLLQVADGIGVSAAYLSKIERDLMPPPAEDKIRGLADFLGLEVEALLRQAFVEKHKASLHHVLIGGKDLRESMPESVSRLLGPETPLDHAMELLRQHVEDNLGAEFLFTVSGQGRAADGSTELIVNVGRVHRFTVEAARTLKPGNAKRKKSAGK